MAAARSGGSACWLCRRWGWQVHAALSALLSFLSCCLLSFLLFLPFLRWVSPVLVLRLRLPPLCRASWRRLCRLPARPWWAALRGLMRRCGQLVLGRRCSGCWFLVPGRLLCRHARRRWCGPCGICRCKYSTGRAVAAGRGCLVAFPGGPCPGAVRVSRQFAGHG